MSAVTFDEVTKKFGEVIAVDSFSLQIADGEFMVLLGPSGCGKSTALRMIAGLEEISSSILTIGERVINHIPPRDRDIAMVFQSYALYPHMTVAKNIESPLVANKHEGGRRRASRVARRRPRSDQYSTASPATSGGQRRSRSPAIVRQPEVFLMDEPLSTQRSCAPRPASSWWSCTAGWAPRSST
jgi:multiple sugar transport system ATP-binding protein